MMEILAVFGAINLMLASAIVIVLPIALAIWITPAWLWLYAVYFALVIIFASIIVGANADEKMGNMRKPGDDE